MSYKSNFLGFVFFRQDSRSGKIIASCSLLTSLGYEFRIIYSNVTYSHLTMLHRSLTGSNAICATLKLEIPVIQTCENYPVIRREIVAPAVFVELSSLEPGKDPGTEEFALRARFEARIVVDSTLDNASLVVRSLAAEVARIVNRNTWNMENVSPAEFISAEGDGFKPELDAYLVWLVGGYMRFILAIQCGQQVILSHIPSTLKRDMNVRI